MTFALKKGKIKGEVTIMKLLATADLHIRNKEDCAVLARILQKAKETACRAVLIGGDLLDRPFIDAQTEEAVLTLLGAASCPVFLVAGNHDPLAVTALYRRLPRGVQIFPAEWSSYTLGEGVYLHGYSSAREEGECLIPAGFTVHGEGVHILLAHGSPEGSAGAFAPISAEALSDFHLAVVGHIHKTDLRQLGRCLRLVPGIPQGRGWDETGERYAYLVDVTADGGISAEPCRVADKIYLEIPVDLTGCADSGEILTKMEGVEIPQGAEVRLILIGQPEESPEAAARLYTERTGREVKDKTDFFVSMALLREQNTLQGAFVRHAMAEIEAADPADRPRLEAALQLGLRALKEAQR